MTSEPKLIRMLPVKAVCNKLDADGKPFEYDVGIYESDSDDDKWVISIETTPGSWFLSDALGLSDWGWTKVSDVMWIDHGQDWTIVNFREVVASI